MNAGQDFTRGIYKGHEQPPPDSGPLSLLIDKSLEWGASKAAVFPAFRIRIREDLAGLCRTCPNRGLAPSCPPHVGGPARFRQWVKTCETALFFSIEVETSLLVSASRNEVFQMLHDLAAGLETEARRLGFSRARAFAGGSCKSVFCNDRPGCSELESPGSCPFSDRARPSMSGFGIDVAGLIKTAGWEKESFLEKKGLSKEKQSGIYGLILLG